MARYAVTGFLCMAVISSLVIWLTAAPGTFGYLLGAILSFLRNLDRMTPNNRRNQRRFEKLFADCYPPTGMRTTTFELGQTSHGPRSAAPGAVF